MIRIIINSLGSGDWVVVQRGKDELFSGHRITPMELSSVLEQLGHATDLVEIDDEQLEEGAY